MSRRRLVPCLLILVLGGLVVACRPPGAVLWGELGASGTGRPAAGAQVVVFDGATFTVVARTAADAEGRYSFDGAALPDGSYRIRFSTADWWGDGTTWETATTVEVRADAPVRIDDTVTMTFGSLTGRISDDLGPVVGLTIEARSARTNALIATATTTAPNGAYSFDQLAAGPYHVRFVGDGYASMYQDGSPNLPGPGAAVVISANTVTNLGHYFVAPESRLEGIVMDGDDPVAGVAVVAVAADGGGEVRGIGVTGPDGTFTIAALWAGTYEGGAWDGDYELTLVDPTGDHAAIAVNRAGASMVPRVFSVVFGGGVDIGTIDITTGEVYVQPYTAVAAGDLNSCAIGLDQALTCWGNAYGGMTTPPPGTFSAVTLGATHACALATDQTIHCWGQDYYEQASPPSGTYTRIDSDGSAVHNCAIATDQTLECWGSDNFGAATPPPGTFLDVSVGANHSCGVTTDLTVECWGFIGIDDPITGTYTAIASGADNDFACAIDTDQALECWGYVWPDLLEPPDGSYTAVAAAAGQACAIATDLSITCWGAGDAGFAPPPGDYVAITAGRYHACAITTDDVAVCFGLDDAGQATPR